MSFQIYMRRLMQTSGPAYLAYDKALSLTFLVTTMSFKTNAKHEKLQADSSSYETFPAASPTSAHEDDAREQEPEREQERDSQTAIVDHGLVKYRPWRSGFWVYHFGNDLKASSWFLLASSICWGFMALDNLISHTNAPSDVTLEQVLHLFRV